MKILIIDAYTFHHLGAGALLINNLKIIEKAFDKPEIKISAFLPKNIKYHTNLPVVSWLDFFYFPSDISNKLIRKLSKAILMLDWKLWKILIEIYYNLSNRFHLSFNPLLVTFSPRRRQVVKAYMEADVIVSIIGELLNESIGYMEFIYFYQLALMFKKKLVFSPNTIGPIFSEKHKKAAKEIFDASTLIIPRDDDSYNYLNLLGVKKKVFTSVIPDVAVLQDYISPEEARVILLKEEIKIDNNAKIIGICVSKWTGLHKSTDYIEEIKDFIKHLTEQGYLILLMPANYPFYEGMMDAPQTDSILCMNIYRQINHSRVFVLKRAYTPEEYKGLLSLLTAFITTRMHASILSTMALIPTLVIATQPKLRGYMRNIKQEDFVIDIDEVTLFRLTEVFNKLMAGRESIIESLRQNRESVQAKTLKIVDLFKELTLSK